MGLLFCREGFGAAATVSVAPVGVPLAPFASHGDFVETALLRGLSVAGSCGVAILAGKYVHRQARDAFTVSSESQ
jgi:hypothetical protein